MFTLTLIGDMFVSLGLTSHADRYGRKGTLMIGAVLSIITGVTFAFQSNFWLLLISAIIGVISPSGNEIGPFMAIELSAISQVTRGEDRTRIGAWYNLFGSFATAAGALFCGIMVSYIHTSWGYSTLFAYRAVMILYSACQVLKLFLFTLLSPAIEVPEATVKKVNPVALFLGLHKSQAIVLKLCLLFVIDSFAGSFVLQSFISAWFANNRATPENKLGLMLFVCNIVAGISALFAAKLADLIGLIWTMGLTHLPSNILLLLVPLMPTQALAIAMLCLRFSISQMDVPTRNAYVQGVVDVDERSAANGVTNVVRSLGASAGPYLATLLYASPSTANYPFYIAGGLKIVYDLLLIASFSSVPTPEEKAKQDSASLLLLRPADSTAIETGRAVGGGGGVESYQQGQFEREDSDFEVEADRINIVKAAEP